MTYDKWIECSLDATSFSTLHDLVNAALAAAPELDEEIEETIVADKVGVLSTPELEFPSVHVHSHGTISVIDREGSVIEVNAEEAELLQDRLAWAQNALASLDDRTPF